MTADKTLVTKFFRSKNIEARHFPKKSSGKKPDFLLYCNDDLFGYCELKSIVDYHLYGESHDPTYNKIQNKIHEASNQFIFSNVQHICPNILFFINHREKINYGDLWYVLTGQTTPPNQPTVILDLRYLKRMDHKNDLANIDYIIWADLNKNIISYTINTVSNYSEVLKRNICSKGYERLNIKNYT